MLCDGIHPFAEEIPGVEVLILPFICFFRDKQNTIIRIIAFFINNPKLIDTLRRILIAKCLYISVDDIEQACRSFCESKDSACVTDFLKRAEMVTPLESADGTLGVHKITPQELACVTFICFNYRFREFSPSSLEPLVRIDRAIAEHFSKPSLKDYAGKTFVCHLLFSNTPYPKGAAIASPKAESYQIVKSFIIERAYSLLSSFCSYISSPSDVGRVVQMLGAEKFLFFVYCDAIFEYLHRV